MTVESSAQEIARLKARIAAQEKVIEAVRAWKEQHWQIWTPAPREYPWQVQGTETRPQHTSDAVLVDALAALDAAEKPEEAKGT